MGGPTVKTMLLPTKCKDGVVIDFYRDDQHYVFDATHETLRAALRMVGYCARNPELNLTWDDAAMITRSIRKNMPKRRFGWF